jgi:hypothetical protein
MVEVRTELSHRILGVPSHEHLAAETDDGLVGLPVPIVLEALPVQVDQPDEVLLRPKDVVGEEPSP